VNIYEIKRLTKETAPFFFNSDTMKFFGQTLKDFRIKKQNDGRFKISAPSSVDHDQSGADWNENHETVRFFNPETNNLDIK
jgi:hypothetical protein